MTISETDVQTDKNKVDKFQREYNVNICDQFFCNIDLLVLSNGLRFGQKALYKPAEDATF